MKLRIIQYIQVNSNTSAFNDLALFKRLSQLRDVSNNQTREVN